MNAHAAITVTVTAEHIAEGIREDCEKCPVALAIRDAFPELAYVTDEDGEITVELGPRGFPYITVSPEEITIQPGPQAPGIHIATPRVVEEFIYDFDDGWNPLPFTFDLDYPEAGS